MKINLVEIIKKNVNDIYNIQDVNSYVEKLDLKNNSKRMYLVQYKNFLKSKNIDIKNVLEIKQEFIPKKDFLDFKEIKTCQKKISDLETDFIFNTLLESGLRISEFNSVKWDQVQNKSFVVKTTKNKNKFRTCFVFDKTFNVLKKLQDEKFNFATLNENRIRYLLRKLGKDAGLKIILTPHTLRRTKGICLRTNGAAIEDIADILGHENMEITRKYYAKLNPVYLESVSRLSTIKTTDSLEILALKKENDYLKRKMTELERIIAEYEKRKEYH